MGGFAQRVLSIMQSCRKAETERDLEMNESTKNEILTGLTGSVELMMSQISDVQVDVPDAEEIADHFDASDIAYRIAAGISSNNVADCIDPSDVADYINASDVADYIVASDIAQHIDASDVADYIDTEEIADYIDTTVVVNDIVAKLHNESEGSSSYDTISEVVFRSLMTNSEKLVSANESLALQLEAATMITNALQDSLDVAKQERNEARELCALLQEK